MSEPFDERLSRSLADRYRIERELGAGGMATVYLAQDLKHDRKVAVKVLRPELAAVIGAERFLSEIRTTAHLQHPHILPLFDSGSASVPHDVERGTRGEAFLFYVMPFIDGESLRDRLNREKQLPIGDAVRIATEVASALDYAHRHGVIHRDIKPENILLHDGSALVADFGIALAASKAGGSRMTETGMSLGTPHYMSPEQAMGEREITARSDVYALGAMTYEMLIGEPPFTGPTAQAIVAKVMTAEPNTLTGQRKSVPAHVEAAVFTALEKLPADRFASAADFAGALSDPSYISATTSRHASQVSRHNQPWKRVALACAGALLLFIIAGAGWLGLRPDGPPARGWRVRMTLPESASVGQGMSLSRDGSVLVYDGDDRIWVRTADGTVPRPLSGIGAAGYSTVSPDGRRVAYLAGLPPAIYVADLAGGSPKNVVPQSTLGAVFGWTDDDHIVYPALGGLIRQAVDGGDGQPLTTIDTARGEVLHIESTGLPDNRGVIFTIVMRNADSSVIAVVGPSGGPVTRLLPGIRAVFAPPGHLIVTRNDGSIIAVAFDPGHRRISGQLVVIASGLRTGGFTAIGRVAVSEGGRLIYVSDGWGLDENPSDLVWMSHDGAMSAVDTAWTGAFQSVAVAASGRRIAAGMFNERTEELFVRDLSSGSKVRVAIPGSFLRDPFFDESGRLYFAAMGAVHGIFRADPGGNQVPAGVVSSEFTWVGHPVIAPGHEQVYYAKALPGGGRLIFRQSLSANTIDTVEAVRGGSASRPAVSPNGRWLAFLVFASEGAEVHVRSVDLTRPEDWLIGAGADLRTSIHWSPAGTELCFVASNAMKSVAITGGTSFQAGSPRTLFSTAGLKPTFDLGNDGRFLMIRWRPALRQPTQLVMLERWTDLLPR